MCDVLQVFPWLLLFLFSWIRVDFSINEVVFNVHCDFFEQRISKPFEVIFVLSKRHKLHHVSISLFTSFWMNKGSFLSVEKSNLTNVFATHSDYNNRDRIFTCVDDWVDCGLVVLNFSIWNHYKNRVKLIFLGHWLHAYKLSCKINNLRVALRAMLLDF